MTEQILDSLGMIEELQRHFCHGRKDIRSFGSPELKAGPYRELFEEGVSPGIPGGSPARILRPVTEPAVVAVTDQRWFDFLSRSAVNGRLDEVNFWRPMAQTEFRSLSAGEPF